MGKRVVLIEDTWVTGATALSTARAIQTTNPASLAIISLARKVNPDALTPEFEAALTQPADLATWVL